MIPARFERKIDGIRIPLNFLGQYFPVWMLEREQLAEKENDYDESFRKWILAFKKLVENEFTPKVIENKDAFRIFRFVVANILILNQKNLQSSGKVALISIPSGTSGKVNSVSLLISSISKIQGFEDFSNLLVRVKTVDSKKSDMEGKLSSLIINENLYKNFVAGINSKEIKSVIFIDDVYTSGDTFESVCKKLFLKSFDKTINFSGLMFGKTLGEKEVQKRSSNNINSGQDLIKGQIFIPQYSLERRIEGSVITDAEVRKIRESLIESNIDIWSKIQPQSSGGAFIDKNGKFDLMAGTKGYSESNNRKIRKASDKRHILNHKDEIVYENYWIDKKSKIIRDETIIGNVVQNKSNKMYGKVLDFRANEKGFQYLILYSGINEVWESIEDIEV